LHDVSGERFQKQIKYMIELLRKEKADEDVDDSVSEQVEENDVDDIDDEEECMAEDEDDEDQLDELNNPVGEDLLVQDFALSGPEAEKVSINYICSNDSSLIRLC
jgi:hypothetical protein